MRVGDRVRLPEWVSHGEAEVHSVLDGDRLVVLLHHGAQLIVTKDICQPVHPPPGRAQRTR